jgi:glycosyltransferase involved in cell wall biosynthesis
MLAEACASVAAQTLQPAEHLIYVDYKHDGPATLINRMVAAAQTEWISILADDDLYDPEHLEALAARSVKADIVLSWCRIEGKQEKQHRGKFDPIDLLKKRDTGMRGCFMFRKSLWERVGGWQEDVYAEDWDFLARAYTKSARFVPVYRETWTYRFHDTNCSHIYAAVINKTPLPDKLYHLARHV